MKQYTIVNRFQGYTIEDCACEYCLYYGGKRGKKVVCKMDKCVCAQERRDARERRRKHAG